MSRSPSTRSPQATHTGAAGAGPAIDRLDTAVVDIATLVVAGRALRRAPGPSNPIRHRSLRRELRAEFKRAAARYLRELAAVRQGHLGEEALARCRCAAEQALPKALDFADELRLLMSTQDGALDGMSAARHDLWRMARISMRLRHHAAALRQASRGDGWSAAKAHVGRVRKCLRRALVAYARACMRVRKGADPSAADCRRAALDALGPGCLSDIEHIAAASGRAGVELVLLRDGVAKPLRDLLLDWQA